MKTVIYFLYSLSPPACIYPDPYGKGTHSRKVKQAMPRLHKWCWRADYISQSLSSVESGFVQFTCISFLPFCILNLINPLQPWMFIGRTDAEAPMLWLHNVKSQFTGKDPDSGKGWGQETGTREDEMVWLHHWLSGHEFEQTSVDSGFPGASGKESACQCRNHKRRRFGLRVGMIPWRRAWQSTPVFLPGESYGQRSLVSYSS